MKKAIFVEGQSEMIFVSDFLVKIFDHDWNRLHLSCLELIADNVQPVSDPFWGDNNSECHYLILNCGNDNSVTSIMRKRMVGMSNKGFVQFIGLRDVYGDIYKKKNHNHRSVNFDIIKEMHDTQSLCIKCEDINSQLHFAVMEFEAWMLGLIEVFINNRTKEIDSIIQDVGFDFRVNIENIYHPSSIIKKIYSSFGEKYDKQQHDIRSFLSSINKNDYINLINSNKCPSFNYFVSSLLDQ